MLNKSEIEIMAQWTGDINKPIVSISCNAYNHEKYIKYALDSFLMQETNFPFEIVVHDDASTDGTANIIKEYEIKYPKIVKPIYETENQFSKNDGSLNRMVFSKIKGKYIAVCEGDDYWIDNKKLQKQVDYFESHDGCSLILANCYEEDQFGNRTECNPFPKSGILDNREVIKENGKLPPTCSMMYLFANHNKMPSFFLQALTGDRTRRFYLLTIGYVYYFDEKMCVYRKNSDGSFSERVTKDKEYAKSIYDHTIEFCNKYDEYTHGKYHNEIEYVKEREEYCLCIRTNDKSRFLRSNYFNKNFKLLDKIIIYASFKCPDYIKKVLKKIIKYGK